MSIKNNFTLKTEILPLIHSEKNGLVKIEISAHCVFRSRIMDFEKLVVKEVYRKSTLTKYRSTEKHLLNYLQWQNTGRDVLLADLRFEFASNFEYYLQPEKGLSINSSGKMIKNLKK